MRAIVIVLSFLTGGLIAGFLIWYLPAKLYPQYTGQAIIRILPGTERGSATDLLKHGNNLEGLADRDKVQQTKWFQRRGTTKDERMTSAIADLKKRLDARARSGSDLVTISMTCENGEEAALIVNETADMFLQRQLSAKRKQITTNLACLEDQQTRLQRDLDLAERAMDDVRRRYGFADLEQHDYPHPITERLIRLQSEEDECTIEIEQLKAQSSELLSQAQTSPKGKAEPNSGAFDKDAQLRLRSLQGRLEGVGKMRAEAEKRQDELDLARAQYAQRKAIRDERRRALDSVTLRIEELKILHDNPDAGGIQLAEYSAIPRKANMLRWQMVIPISGAAGFLLGIVCVLLARPGGKKSALTNIV